jgi:ParB-like chromosome segregation protein Spo0J
MRPRQHCALRPCIWLGRTKPSIDQTTRYLPRKLYLSVRLPCLKAETLRGDPWFAARVCSSFRLVGSLYGGLFVGTHLRFQNSDFRLIDSQRRGCDCRQSACENESLAHSINPQLRDAMAELTCADHRGGCLQLVSESLELHTPEQNTATELKPINNPPARPAPHPICLLIPSADEDELQDLTDDIRAHGLIAPIVLFEGMILDGRNRAAACERAGIAPRYVSFEGGREDALILVVSHNLKRRHLTKQAIADALVAAEDFNLHYMLAEPVAATATDGPEAQSVIKITEPKTASSRKLAQAAGRVVSHVMIAATRKVKEKGEPELQEAVKRGRIGVQDAAKAADLPPEQQKAIAVSPKPRRAAAEAAEAAKSAVPRAGGAAPRGGMDRHAALRKAWEGANALRGLWDTADDRTKEWFVGTVLFDSDEAGEPAG